MNNAPILAAKIFSLLFLLLTLFGFISNLLPTGSALLKTNTILIVAHLALTFVFFFVAYLCTGMSIQTLQMIGVTYILISGIGFIGLNIQINGEWPHVIYLNLLSYFQFGLGIALCASGSVLKNYQSKIAAQ
jgi:hypothetical protein